MTASHHAAAGYAARGWAVFPLHTIRGGRCCSCRRWDCSHPAKHPLTRHGLHDATTSPDQIRRWSVRWPWANVGIATGAASDLVVIDVDPRSGGDESLAWLESLMGSLPHTLAVSTGGGGRHLLYGHPGIELGNTAGRLPGVVEALPGVDLRADGGYVVAPPSRHASGRPYRWVSDPNGEPAAAPAWLRPAPVAVLPATSIRPTLVAAAGGSRYGLAALRRETADVRRAAVGERNNRLNRAAFSLGMLAAGGELDEDLVEDELLAAAVAAGLSEREARASIRSGLRGGGREPRRRPAS